MCVVYACALISFSFFFVFLDINSLLSPFLPFFLVSSKKKKLPGQELIRESPPFPFQKKQPGPGLVGTHSLTHLLLSG